MQKASIRFFTCFFEFSILSGLLISLSSSQIFAKDTVHEQSANPVWQRWKTVGHSTLKWGFWVIYDAHLKTPSGIYKANDTVVSDMALLIDYRRTISKKRLLSATNEQWLHLGVPQEDRERWIQELNAIWKGVQKGDRLVFVLTESGGRFYFGNVFLGRIDDLQLARSFIDIWLSENTAYPALRRELLGQ